MLVASLLALALAKEPTATEATQAPEVQGCELTCSDPEICARLETFLRKKPLPEAQISFVAQRLHERKPLAACNAQLPLNPASNAKLWTTAAAITKLGAAHRYATRLYYRTDRVKDGVLQGDLYIKTQLDPSLVTGHVFEMAQTLFAKGLRSIQGRLVFDLEPKRRKALPPAYDQKDEMVSYRTAIGSPSVNYNTFVVWVMPGTKNGSPAQVAIVPPIPNLRVENLSKTSRGSSNRARVTLVRSKNERTSIRVEGKVGIRSSQRSTRLPRYDPTQYAAEVFTQALTAAGITLKGKKFGLGRVPDRASLAIRHDSRPLGELIRSVNKFSNNFMAEQILWSLGGASSSPKDAAQELGVYARSIGAPTQGLHFGNGSGLYDANRMSAEQIVHLLRSVARDFRVAPDYLASLAIMGEDGTTRRRLHTGPAKGWIRAKTGTLDSVSALSGYIGAPGKEPIVFSILINGFKRWEIGQARLRQDQIALELQQILASVPSPQPATPALKEK